MCALFDPPVPRRVSSGEYPMWDQALALVNRDLAVTLPQLEPLRLLALPSWDSEEPEYVYVAMANGEWHGNHLDPDSQDGLASALASVADAAQETVMELLWQVWPLCPEHGLGMHLTEDAQERLSWQCAGERSRRGPAHIHAAVGALDASGASPRTRS
ncbi:hypothetical protein ACF1E9_27080 [Streptomyces roseolus]|uniref:hypothetical protein n=1 Tax=Streptomyces roseolus TaxID=67358 RepID=UPI0036F4C49B